MPAKKQIDPTDVRKLAMIGATLEEIARYLGCSHDTIERRFRDEVEAGRAEGAIAAKGRIYKKGVINGEFTSLALYLAHQCGWTMKPDVSVITNVVQNATPQRSPEEVKRHLVELQRAVLEECRKYDDQAPQLPT
jgi:hypothetical protein